MLSVRDIFWKKTHRVNLSWVIYKNPPSNAITIMNQEVSELFHGSEALQWGKISASENLGFKPLSEQQPS